VAPVSGQAKVRLGGVAGALLMLGVLDVAALSAAGMPDYLGPSALVASRDGKTLYVAHADAWQVAWVDLASGTVTRRVDVPAEPTGLALAPDGSRLYVTCAAPRSSIVALDPQSGRLLATIAAGHTAMGPSVAPDGKRLYVCNRFNNDVSVIDLPAGREVARVKATREPVATALTPDGRTLLVANHLPNQPADAYPLAADVTFVDTRTNQATPVPLAHGSHSVRGVCVSPDGRLAYVTHLLSNFEMVPSQVQMGWMSSNVLSVIDIEKKKVRQTVGLDDPQTGMANPWGVACTADGAWVCVAHAGTHELSVVSSPALLKTLSYFFTSPAVGAITNDFHKSSAQRRIKLPGNGPRALTIVGSKVYVGEYFSDTLAVVDLNARAGAAPLPIALGPAPSLSVERRGEMLFNDATLCYENWQSCASCHPDGRTDVLNWDLMNDGVGNPKSTRSMVLAYQTPPSMFEGVRADSEAAVRAGFENILFSTRPDEEIAAINEYIRLLQPVSSPPLVDGRLSPAAKRGQRLFESEAVGCAKCHPEPLYTDMLMHKLGTRSPVDYTDRFDTPTLVEVWRTAPYLHDGRYLTVKDLLVKGKHGNTHGGLDKLTAQQIDDLVEFVLSL
jgi:YVTN family beta-propeller protein